MRRDYDPDLERDDFETRELNAGGVRAKRIREQHDAEVVEESAREVMGRFMRRAMGAEPYCPWCTDGIDPETDEELCGLSGCKPLDREETT